MPTYPADDEGARLKRVGALHAASSPPLLSHEILLVRDFRAHRTRLLGIGDRLVRVLAGHRPVNERAFGVAIAEGRIVVLAVLENHRVGAATNRGRLANARCLDRLDAHRSRRKQATEQHPIAIEPETKRLIPVPRLQRLTAILVHVVGQFDLPILLTNDDFAAWQFDQDRRHQLIVTAWRGAMPKLLTDSRSASG